MASDKDEASAQKPKPKVKTNPRPLPTRAEQAAYKRADKGVSKPAPRKH